MLNVKMCGGRSGALDTNPKSLRPYGGYISSVISVTAGSTLYVYVGGGLGNTFNGGGAGHSSIGNGAGATDIRTLSGGADGTLNLESRLVVAGGSGGGNGPYGGAGGGFTGGTGAYAPNYPQSGGLGGTQKIGGAGSTYEYEGRGCHSSGMFGIGGSCLTGNGGGGGWYGGGAAWDGAGGGSSYTTPNGTVLHNIQGYPRCHGNGWAVIIPYAFASLPVSYYPASTFPGGFRVVESNLVGLAALPSSYSISFDVYPTADGHESRNILSLIAHSVSKTGAGGCLPCLYFSATETGSRATLSLVLLFPKAMDQINDREGVDKVYTNKAKPLPLNEWSNVSISVDSSNFFVTLQVFGGVNISPTYLSFPRQPPRSNVLIYASTPNQQGVSAASANIRNLNIMSLDPPFPVSLPVNYYPASTFPDGFQLVNNNLRGIVTLPSSYSISFDLYPTAATTDLTIRNVLDLISNGRDSGLPSVSFCPSGVGPALGLQVAYNGTAVSYIQTSKGLPLTTWSLININVDTIKKFMTLSVLNDASSSSESNIIAPSQMTSDYSSVLVYASSPGQSNTGWRDFSAGAKIRNLNIKSLLTPSPSSSPTMGPSSSFPTPVPSANPSSFPTPNPSSSTTLRPSSSFPTPVLSANPSSFPTPNPTTQTNQWQCKQFISSKTNGGTVNYATCSFEVCGRMMISLTLSLCSSHNGSHTGPVLLALEQLPNRNKILPRSIFDCSDDQGQYQYSYNLKPSLTGSCSRYVVLEGCNGESSCSGRVVALGAFNESSFMAFAPTIPPTINIGAKLSEPTTSPTQTKVGSSLAAKQNENKSSLSTFTSVVTVHIILIFCFIAAFASLAYYIYYIRKSCEYPVSSQDEDAGKDDGDMMSSVKVKTKPIIVPFGFWDCMLTIPLIGGTFISNMVQSQSYTSDHKALAASVIVVRLASCAVSAYMIRALLFKEWLSKYAEAHLFNKAQVWVAVSLVALLDPSQIRLFPWSYNEFCYRSGGYPNMAIFKVAMGSTVANSFAMTILSGVCFRVGVSGSGVVSLLLSLISLLFASATVMFRIQAESIHNIDINVEKSRIVALQEENDRIRVEASQAVDRIARLQLLEDENKDEIQRRTRKEKEIGLELALALAKMEKSNSASSKDKAYDTNIKYADEQVEVLKSQLEKKGEIALEYIPLAELQAELGKFMEKCNAGELFDERRMEYLLQCLESNPDYLRQREKEENEWRLTADDYTSSCLILMKGYISPDIFTSSVAELNSLGMSIELAKRLMAKKCLWLIRMSVADIQKIHEAELTNKYSFEGQGLDIVELAALYAHVPRKLLNDGVMKKKTMYTKKLESSIRSMMGEEKAGRLTGAKARHPAYKSQDPLFAMRETLFQRRASNIVQGGDGKRDSWKHMKGESLETVRKKLENSFGGDRSFEKPTIVSSTLSAADKQATKNQLEAQFAPRIARSSTFGSTNPLHSNISTFILASDKSERPSNDQCPCKLDKNKISALNSLFQRNNRLSDNYNDSGRDVIPSLTHPQSKNKSITSHEKHPGKLDAARLNVLHEALRLNQNPASARRLSPIDGGGAEQEVGDQRANL